MVSEAEKSILDLYFKMFLEVKIPDAAVIAKEIDADESYVHTVLRSYYYVHLYAGKKVCDCQNILLQKWFPETLLLETSKRGENHE